MSLRSRLGFGEETIFLMDGSAFVYRAFYALRNMSRADGFPTNVLFIVTKNLLKILREERPTYFSFILDGKGKTHRNELYDLYKANRSATPEELIKQLEPLKAIIHALGIPSIVSCGCEADDCIASLTNQFKHDHSIVIVGADKDLKQCLDTNVILWDPASKDEKITTFDSFVEETGMHPSSWPDYQALVGDSSDNIPGIAKIGPKTALGLIHDFPTLEDIFSRLPAVPPKVRTKLEGQKENAMLYRELTRLTTNACGETHLPELHVQPADISLAIKLMEEYDLRSLAREVASMERAGIWNPKTPSSASFSSKGQSQPGQLTQSEQLAQPGQSTLSGQRTQPEQILQSEQIQKKREANNGTLSPKNSEMNTAHEVSTAEQVALFAEKPVSFSAFTGELDKVRVLMFSPNDHDALLIATETEEGIYTGTCEALVEALQKNALPLVTPDMKELCKKYPLLWSLQNWFDISLAAYLIEPEERTYSLPHVAGRYAEEVASQHDFHNHPGLFSLDLYSYLLKRLSGASLTDVFTHLEIPLVSVLASMEERGIAIDKQAFSVFLSEVQNTLDELTQRIYSMAGGTFNIRSSQQLSDILFERLGLPKAGKTKGGAMSTSQTALEKLVGKHSIIDAILEYRKLEKLRSTYLEPLPNSVLDDQRIHTTFNQTTTATGRLSSSNPNMQNIPIRGAMGGRMRSCFVAGEGKVLVGADYSQIELRVLAHLSKDPNLLSAFHNNEDIHTRTAALLFDVSSDEVTAELRRKAKTINFGLIYGMGAQKLAQDLGISMKEAKEFMERYFEKLVTLKQYFESIEKDAIEYGYVTTMAGRKRMTPDITSDNTQMRSMARRQAINTCIQGSAADIIKLAMLAVEHDSELQRLEARLLLQIHDELLIEVAPEYATAAGNRLVHLMSSVTPGGIELSVPLLVEWGTGKSWGDTH